MKVDKYTIAYYAILFFGMMWFLYIPKSRVVGTYVNNNTSFVLEGPVPIDQYVDTLIILHNGGFTSRTWGKGTYELSGRFVSSTIKLKYEYSMGKASSSMNITKPIFGSLRIWLNHDLGFYFRKID